MSNLHDLSRTSLLSFELGDDCNMKQLHPKCPINHRKYQKCSQRLTVQTIVSSIRQAFQLKFTGYVAFHYYNEPLLYRDEIIDVMDAVPEGRYMLWTNGLLLDPCVENNTILRRFDYICITCYDSSLRPFFEQIREFHGHVDIFDWEFDDRLKIYTNNPGNKIGCKRPLFELPIDCYGNVHLCCFDWNNQYEIGNINDTRLEDIIKGPYQKVLKLSEGKILDYESCPDICKRCHEPWIRYPHYFVPAEDMVY